LEVKFSRKKALPVALVFSFIGFPFFREEFAELFFFFRA